MAEFYNILSLSTRRNLPLLSMGVLLGAFVGISHLLNSFLSSY